ncbi:MAG: XrtA/PEP-CTERM system histidine kinase PrsK [Pseudomonadota bacterium]
MVGQGEGHGPVHVEDAGGPAAHHGPLPGLDVGAFLLLAVLMFSGQIRAHMRVFLSKHFFSYAYDYREQWLAITAALSKNDPDFALEKRVIMAIAQLVESPGGLLWVRDARGDFVRKADFGIPGVDIDGIDANEPLIKFVESHGWVVNVSEMEVVPELYDGLERPEWLAGYRAPWVFVPLFQGSDLFGLVLLARPRSRTDWNWEVIDLLKTAGIQAASYLALDDAARALAEARQFEGFNRLSAYVMHDLKNLTNQLSLVIRNTERHHDNPEFMKDMVKTVEHAVGKMNRLMSQLKSAGAAGVEQSILISEMLDEVVQLRSKQLPVPTLFSAVKEPIMVFADRDRFASSFEYVIQNAQEAAGRKGTVHVKLHSDRAQALVDVKDDGHGMEAGFIREHLFRPFKTTKGLTGMGIGAYESREYIRSLGGDVKVASEVGKGTTFRFIVPLAEERSSNRPDSKGGMI